MSSLHELRTTLAQHGRFWQYGLDDAAPDGRPGGEDGVHVLLAGIWEAARMAAAPSHRSGDAAAGRRLSADAAAAGSATAAAPPPPPPPPPATCKPIMQLLDHHLGGEHQRRSNRRTLVAYSHASGLGDAVAGFLGRVAPGHAHRAQLPVQSAHSSQSIRRTAPGAFGAQLPEQSVHSSQCIRCTAPTAFRAQLSVQSAHSSQCIPCIQCAAQTAALCAPLLLQVRGRRDGHAPPEDLLMIHRLPLECLLSAS